MASPRHIAPLSGEIMSDARQADASLVPRHDVVDVEFETVARTEPALLRKPAEPVAHGLDILSKKASEPVFSRAGVGFWAGGMALAAAAFWMAGGHVLFDVPGGGQAAEADLMRVASLTTRVAQTASGEHLLIDGELENHAARTATAPDLEIEVKAVGGGTTRYRLGNGGELIAAGQALRFSSRLAAPATGVRSVSVSVKRIEGS
ncbi:MAG: hypothetical protein WBA44_03175 [Mesorhizobium sp.]